MGHKCYISFKQEDALYKEEIQKMKALGLIDFVDKSLNQAINSSDNDYIMRRIRQDYLSDSTVTIFLIGEFSRETLGWQEQQFIKRELQASLYDGDNSPRSGILGVVLPSMYNRVFKGSYLCTTCGYNHDCVDIGDATVIKEFSANFYIEPHFGCNWSEDERYCVLAKWSDFVNQPNMFIDKAFNKRSEDIAQRVKVYPR